MFALGAWKAFFGTSACHAYYAGFLLRSPLGFEKYSAYAPLLSPLEGLESNSINGNANVSKRETHRKVVTGIFPSSFCTIFAQYA